MFTSTVYRINCAQTRRLLYIGCTYNTLEGRMKGHIYMALRQLTAPDFDEFHHATQCRVVALAMHAAGIRPLTITAIEVVDGYYEGYVLEKALISTLEPPWNIVGVKHREEEVRAICAPKRMATRLATKSRKALLSNNRKAAA